MQQQQLQKQQIANNRVKKEFANGMASFQIQDNSQLAHKGRNTESFEQSDHRTQQQHAHHFHHASTQYVRTQSQEYLQSVPKSHIEHMTQMGQPSFDMSSKVKQKRQQRGALSIGATVMNTTEAPSKNQVQFLSNQYKESNLFEQIQRKTKLTSARPLPAEQSGKKHSHITKLLQQQTDQVNLLQFRTPQQSKNPFAQVNSKISQKGSGTQMDQIRKAKDQQSQDGHQNTEIIRQQYATTHNQRASVVGHKNGQTATNILNQSSGQDAQINSNEKATKQIILGSSQIPGYGVVDSSTIFTLNNQNRQVRILSKNQLKQMHYSYQPTQNNQQQILGSTNQSQNSSKLNKQQVISQKQNAASPLHPNNPQASAMRKSIKEKFQGLSHVDATEGFQSSGPQVLYSNGLYNLSPFNDHNRIPVYLNNQSNLNKGQLITDKNVGQGFKNEGLPGNNRQLSPTYRAVDQMAAGQGQANLQNQGNFGPSSFTSSGLEYLANIANIAQTSPQYVLDKNAIKAEIVNQAAIAARNSGVPAQIQSLLNNSNLQGQKMVQNSIQNAHQRYDQQEKLIKAFRHVVASGNVDQLSGLEMLQRWQVLYGQAQQDSGFQLSKNRNQPRFEAHRSATGVIRGNSLDCKLGGFQGQAVQAEQLMQNLKISQLNQISSILDHQTEKLIEHTQKLMNNNVHVNVDGIGHGIVSLDQMNELNKSQQEVLISMQQYRPGARYRSSYSGIQQKHYDRQRMLDFYSQIRMGDLDDQAKLRSQAIKQAPPLDPNKLRYSVLNGNNSRLIRNAMARRKDFWLETTNSDPHFHFKWQSCSHGIKFDIVGKDIAPEVHPCQKQIVNHFENHSCISEKSKLFLNLSQYAQRKLNENVFDFLPLTFFVECDLQKQKQYSKSMVQFMNAFYALDDIKKRTKKFYQKLDSESYTHQPNRDLSTTKEDKDYQYGSAEEDHGVGRDGTKEQLLDDNFIFKHFYQNKILLIRQHKKEEREEKEAYMEALGANINHFHQSHTKSMKRFDLNGQNMSAQKSPFSSNLRGQNLQNQESCENITNYDGRSPQTNQSMQKQTQNKILKKYFHRQSMPFCHYSGNNLWILKATKLNQGQGIHVCNNLPQIKTLIQRYCEGFPKQYTENFQYEKELISNKRTTAKATESTKASATHSKIKSAKSSASKKKTANIANGALAEREQSEERERISEDEEEIEERDDVHSDSDGGEDNPHQKDENGLKKRHFSNSKLSFSVPSTKKATGSAKKIATLNVINQQMSAGNSIKRLKGSKFEPELTGVENLDKTTSNLKTDLTTQSRKKDHQTPRGESRNKKHRGMLSPKQNQNAYGSATDNVEQVKTAEKQKNLNVTQPDYMQQTQKPLHQGEPKYKHNSFIIQKYIERPLLIDQRKFDIRVWVFLDSKGNAYICRPGYLRTSSYKFELDPDDPDNRFVHLTNIAVQKYSQDFGAHEDGNILNYMQFEQYVKKTWPHKNFNLERDLIFKIRQQISRTLFATRKIMDPHKRANQTACNSNFFELFGYDFMIDEDFNVWLIECNTNPSLAESAQYLEQLIPRMIEDMIKLTVDEEYMYYYKQIIQVNKQLIAQTEDPSELPDDLADQSCLDNLIAIKSPSLIGFDDHENVWEKFLNLNSRMQRKDAKAKYNVPIEMNSKYAFNIKNRDFKIKKYINYRSQLEQAMNTASASNTVDQIQQQQDLHKLSSSKSVNKISQSPTGQATATSSNKDKK